MHWVPATELSTVPLVSDFHQLLSVILDDRLTEFQYVAEGDEWRVVLR